MKSLFLSIRYVIDLSGHSVAHGDESLALDGVAQEVPVNAEVGAEREAKVVVHAGERKSVFLK